VGSKEALSALIADLTRVKQELGRTPSRPEYLRHGKFNTLQIMDIAGGGYRRLLELSHLKYSGGRRDKQEIRREVYEHLVREVEEKKKIVLPPKLYRNLGVWPDKHKPYHHIDTNYFLIEADNKYKFDGIVDIGDGEDFHGMSFHDSDPDLLSAGHELRAVILDNKVLYDRFKEVMIVDSNHSSMIHRKAKHHGIPRHVLKPLGEVLEAPKGWTWHQELVLQMSSGQKVLFVHSLGSNVLAVSQKRGMSCVQGHHHSKFSIQYWANYESTFFACQTGCLVDDTSMAMAYNKGTVERPVLGMLRITEGIPHLIPMQLDKHGRWTGKIP
jgi:hypothetical protein